MPWCYDNGVLIGVKGSDCTHLDHIYPSDVEIGHVVDGTPCYCGKRRWNMEKIVEQTQQPVSVPDQPDGVLPQAGEGTLEHPEGEA
jgi:hypothetical protein